MRTALVQVVAAAVRCPTVLEDDGASCILCQLQAQALACVRVVSHYAMSKRLGPQPMDDLAEFAQGLLRTQLLQCASQHIAAASQCLRGALASSNPSRSTAGSANSGGDLDAGRVMGWPTVLTAIDNVFGFTNAILPVICICVHDGVATGKMLPYVTALAAALRDSAIMEHTALEYELMSAAVGP
jgi:hypothetical protein